MSMAHKNSQEALPPIGSYYVEQQKHKNNNNKNLDLVSMSADFSSNW